MKTHLKIYLILITAFSTVILWFSLVYLDNALPDVFSNNKKLSSIAVMPIKNISGHLKDEYIADGFTLDITTGLSKLPGTHVIANTSIFAFKGYEDEINTVATELGVRYILSGTMDRNTNIVKIKMNLFDTKNRSTLWEQGFLDKDENIFDIQKKIINKTSEFLNDKYIFPSIDSYISKKTKNIKAYSLFHRGLIHYLRRNREDNHKARQDLLEAINLDPGFAHAYAVIANTHRADFLGRWSKNPELSLLKALQLANKAVEMEPDLPQSHFILGLVLRELRIYKQAIESSEKAIELNPNYADAYVLLASVLCYKGTPLNSLELIDKAIELNPKFPTNYSFHIGQCNFTMGRFEQALHYFENTHYRNPVSQRVNLWLASTFANLNQVEDAAMIIDEVLLINPLLTVKEVKKFTPYTDPIHMERLLFGLQLAGLK